MISERLTRTLEAIDGCTVESGAALAQLTTLHLGGCPKALLKCSRGDALVAAVRALDEAGERVLVIAGGSNLVIADGDLDLVAVHIAHTGVEILDGGVVRAQAGTMWDEVVAATVEAGLGGLECLSGIPGSAGATPVQNVGAYGAEVSEVLSQVQLYDRETGEVSWVPAESLELSYRRSNLKYTNRAVVLAVEFQLHTDGLCAPLRYGELARRLGAQGADERFPAAQVREHVLELRRGKGMVLIDGDHDTWSVGSFFTNPIVNNHVADFVAAIVADKDPADAETMPRYAAGDGQVKLSAAWLIERADFPKGYEGPGGRVSLSTKHTLALTNRGEATTADLVALAREIRDGVKARFAVELTSEPVWVGVEF